MHYHRIVERKCIGSLRQEASQMRCSDWQMIGWALTVQQKARFRADERLEYTPAGQREDTGAYGGMDGDVPERS